MLESAVAYDGLPISSGGAHGLGRITAREALDSWLRFLSSCTQAAPIESWFDFPDTPGLNVDADVFGLIEDRFPSQSGRFLVAADQVDDAIALFESLEPLPANEWRMAPVWLWFTAQFQLRSPSSDALWPGQDPAEFGHFQTPGGVLLGTSSTRLILQAKRSMGLSLSIPDATDDDLDEIVPWLGAALPFRLSPKHWTRWTRTRTGSYRGRRIAPN